MGGKALEPGSSPRLTIVIATYNPGGALEETLRSVYSQTFRDFEIVVVDGGSSDGTLEVLWSDGGRIGYWISEPDEGVYDAYNKGIDLARGEWVYFIGAGDVLADDQVLERVFSSSIPGDLVYADVLLGKGGERYDGRFGRFKLCRRNICHQSIFYRRALFRDLGKFETRYRVQADRAFNMRCFGDRRVRPVYLDMVVAVFQKGGLSDSGPDREFDADRLSLIRECFGRRYLLLMKAYMFQKEFVNALVNLARSR